MRSIAVIMLIACLFTNCDEENLRKYLPSLSATIDGESWISFTRIVAEKNGTYIITATDLNGEILTITIFGTETGTYELNVLSVQVGALYKKSASTSTNDSYVAVSGVAELTEVNEDTKRISGNFEFILTKGIADQITITNGEFVDLKVTVEDS